MKILYRATVYDAAVQPENARVAFFDSLLRLSSGEWLCGFTAGPTKHHPTTTIRICRSTDDGKAWTLEPTQFSSQWEETPGSLTGSEMVECSPGKLLLFATWFDRTDPDRPLFDPVTEGILRSKQLFCESADGGRTWGPWRLVPTPGLSGCATTGPVVRWTDGTIGHAFESFKEFDDPTPARHGAWLVVSRDGGRTFEPPHLVAQDPENEVYYWDQRLCEGRNSGEYLALFWTHDRRAKRDRRVHIVVGSINRGAALGDLPAQPIETTIPGQIAAPLLLKDGRLLAFVVDRNRPGSLRLWQSHDLGHTWPLSESLAVHMHEEQAQLSQGASDIDFAQYWEDMCKWTFGHPTIRLIDEHAVMVTYYAGVPGCMGILSAVVDID